MIAIGFETANLVETPLADDGAGRGAWLGPGTRALVHLTLRNSEKRSATKTIAISGMDGSVFYDGQPTGEYARGGDGYMLRWPFRAGTWAVVQVETGRGVDLQTVDTVVIGHDGQDPWGGGPEWFLKRVIIVMTSVGYEFVCNQWLRGPDVTLDNPSSIGVVPGGSGLPFRLAKPPATPVRLPAGVFHSSRFNQASFA